MAAREGLRWEEGRMGRKRAGSSDDAGLDRTARISTLAVVPRYAAPYSRAGLHEQPQRQRLACALVVQAGRGRGRGAVDAAHAGAGEVGGRRMQLQEVLRWRVG